MASGSDRRESASTIDLAHEPNFRLGGIIVYPGLRQILRSFDRAEELIEPRVMQVLVALARAEGGIVTRDELVRDCWEGRFVGEDAINRALSRVRKLSEGIGKDAFALETVTKVGYRLVVAGRESHGPNEAARPAAPNRRIMLASGAAAAALATVGGWALLRRRPEPPLAPGTDALMQQAMVALSQYSREGHNQAIGLYRRVVDANPDYADGWGALGNAYAVAALSRPRAEAESLRLRARAAGRRALALDSGNGFGQVALARSRPLVGHWLSVEQALRRAIAQNPDNGQLLFGLVTLLMSVGRLAQALPPLERMERLLEPVPETFYHHIMLLWCLDRLEEADRLIEQAASLYPTHYAIWFIRFYVLMYSGRASAAIALAEDLQARPTGIRDSEIDSVIRMARAVQTGDPSLVDSAVAEQVGRAHRGAGYAENAIVFASAVGRLDSAFAVAEAYYFDRGFVVPEVSFQPEQGIYTPLGDRQTGILFKPPVKTMWRDPRFSRLVGEIGLADYWRRAGASPDYRRSASA